MASLKSLKSKRASAKGSLTRIKTFVDTTKNPLVEELECRLSLLETCFTQLTTIQDDIEIHEEAAEADKGQLGDIEDTYFQVKAKLLSSIAKLRKEEAVCSHNTSKEVENLNQPHCLPPKVHSSHLPKVQLPMFSGNCVEYTNFINTFQLVVVNDKNLTETEKFLHLRASLTGEAFQAVAALEITDVNFSEALKLLNIRYGNKTIIFETHTTRLFNIPTAAKSSAMQLRSVIDTINVHYSALKSLGSADDILNAILIHLGKQKVDRATLVKWEESQEYDNLPTWETFSNFINIRGQFLCSRESADHSKPMDVAARGSHSNRRSALTTFLTNPKCLKCKSSQHFISKCSSMLSLEAVERFLEIKRLGLCINCLRKGHSVTECKSSKCRVCLSPHHTILHRYDKSSSPSQHFLEIQNSNTRPQDNKNSSSLHTAIGLGTDQVILATALVNAEDQNGQDFPVRVLLDSASQSSFITEALSQRLNLPTKRIDTEVNGIGVRRSRIKFGTSITIKSRINDFITKLDTLIIPTITTSKPETQIDHHNWKIPSDIQLADPTFYKPQRIDVLLGAEVFYLLLGVGKIQLDDKLLILQETVFGWIVSGKLLNCNSNHRAISNLIVDIAAGNNENTLSQQLEQFWTLEEVAPAAPHWTQEQIMCEHHFINTTSRAEDGKFIVKLPFKHNQNALGESRTSALRSLARVERMLGQDDILKKQYNDFMQEYEDLGHMSRANIPDSQIKYMIPHRGVLRPDSTTTKLRVVFNASSPTSNRTSLNDMLMVGPTIQPELYDIMVKFRSYKYALTADITKMYRQVWIHPEDRQYLGILWRTDSTKPPTTYILNTVTYGTASAPFQAVRCLKELGLQCANELPVASDVLQNSFYVDDMIAGSDTSEELVKLKNQVQKACESAGFHLRKWTSNDIEFIKSIPEGEREKYTKFDKSEVVKTLGMIWDPFEDEFRFTCNLNATSDKFTKRAVLSGISSLFDPLGLISPCIVPAKILMQRLWSKKLSWDESIPADLQNEWSAYRKQLAEMPKLRLPRHVYSKSYVKYEIHGFADASLTAFGCCVYVRCLSMEGAVKTMLVSAKSRVAPLKTQSLPRLELCAALLLAKLYNRIKSSFVMASRVVLWTDSQIALHWIHGESGRWTVFVANRVAEIQQLTGKEWWRHVPSQSNAADLISRGCLVKGLQESSWFTGPKFLEQMDKQWPCNPPAVEESAVPDRRKIKCTLVISQPSELSIINTDAFVNHFLRLRRIIAYVLRFICRINYCLQRKKGMDHLGSMSEAAAEASLSVSELDEAERRIVYYVQSQAFQEEIRALKYNRIISQKSPLKPLCPFLGDEKPPLLRVGGRLAHSNLPYSVKHPILLPKNHPFSLSILTHMHKKYFHAGVQSLVAASRQQYWIINVKGGAKHVIKRCLHCFHYRPKTIQQIMGDLPAQRVQRSISFTTTGVDFCGPIYISTRIRGRPLQKAYLAVFVCFATKATHLEVVSDLSTEAFMLALKRFISRRGLCHTIFCDNATNFTGAKSKLTDLHKTLFNQANRGKLQQLCAEDKISFRFIPPRSPHFGGLWEATVKVAKFHLYRVVHNSQLSFEELSTLTAQIEAILNSRPLGALSEDPNDEEVLTPGHFLIGRALTTVPEPDITAEKHSLLTRWQHVRQLQQHFWKRWIKEYISQLQQRYKWNSKSPNVKENMLVLIADDNQPPQKWLIGRILHTYPGEDGHIRVVDVKTKQGTYRRAITKLAPLPILED